MDAVLEMISWSDSERNRDIEIEFTGRSSGRKKNRDLLLCKHENPDGAEEIGVYELDELDVMDYERLVNDDNKKTARISSEELWEMIDQEIEEGSLESINE